MTTKIVPMPPLTTENMVPVATACIERRAGFGVIPHRSENMRDEAGLEPAQFVRRADEEAVDRRDAPALVVRREQLHETCAARRRSHCPPRRTQPASRTKTRTSAKARTQSSPAQTPPRTKAGRVRPFASAAGARDTTHKGPNPAAARLATAPVPARRHSANVHYRRTQAATPSHRREKRRTCPA